MGLDQGRSDQIADETRLESKNLTQAKKQGRAGRSLRFMIDGKAGSAQTKKTSASGSTGGAEEHWITSQTSSLGFES